MINITNELQFLLDGTNLDSAIAAAMADTRELLTKTYAASYTVDPERITAGKNNILKHCAFVRYFPERIQSYNHQWVLSAFDAVHNNTTDSFTTNKATILPSLGLIENIPAGLALELYRGLRIFFLALWSRRGVLLPMNFSLPNTKRKGEIAWPLYTEVLAICRSPFVSDIHHVPDISAFIKPSAKRNFDWYAWRPVIASDWHYIEAITTEDAIMVFEELSLRRKRNSDSSFPAYPVTPVSLLQPIRSVAPDRCHFNVSQISDYNPLRIQTPDGLQQEVDAKFDDRYGNIKAIWASYEERYLKQLKEVKRIKSLKNYQAALGHLNRYLFSVLPQNGHTPPSPKEFDRKYLEGTGVPPLRHTVTKRDGMGAIERFFQFLEEIAPFEDALDGFVSPIIYLDKQRERRRQVTSKKVFRLNDFRLARKLALAIADFSWHVAKTIGTGNAPDEWYDILSDASKCQVLDTEQFGFVPTFSYQLTSGVTRDYRIRWIPKSLLAIRHFNLKCREGWTPLPQLHSIHQIIVGLETGIRNIHIRWLDKHFYLADAVDAGASDFMLRINTDKVTGPWDRVCSKEVLTVLERQIESQAWFRSDHFETTLPYDDHELSDFGKICPIFMQYDKPRNATLDMTSKYYRWFVYYINLTKISFGEASLDPLPTAIEHLSFTQRSDFEKAELARKGFRSKFTPHGTRATVISSFAPLLPPHVIGEEISGHVSDAMVLYYTKLDSSHLEPVRKVNRELAKLEKGDRMLFSLRTERGDSALRRALFESSIEDFVSNFGACSMYMENNNGDIVSGLKEIAERGIARVKLHPTHICPLGDECPPEIVNTIGAKSCGQCPYSIKTVDHLPRILAHTRALGRQIDNKKIQLAEADEAGVPDGVLVEIEKELVHLASEASAWALTGKILAEKCTQLAGRALIDRPDILSQAIEIARPDSELDNLLIQCEEALSYPELTDSALQADVAKLRPCLLAMTGSVEQLFTPLDGRELIDDFRGLVRSICMTTGATPKELAEQMEKPLQISALAIRALEKLHA